MTGVFLFAARRAVLQKKPHAQPLATRTAGRHRPMNVPTMYTMPREWRFARFDEFLRRVDRKFILDDTATYKCVGVRWYGMGAFVREVQLGADISRKQQWVIKRGDVIYNKLFGWKGAFAIADGAVDGCIVSDKFPTYRIDCAQVEPQFLGHYFRTPQIAQQAQDLSKGAAAISKLTLNPPQFWDLKIPLPPLDEQRRIVARVEQLAAKIQEARQLRGTTTKEVNALHAAALSAALGCVPIEGQLGDVLLSAPRNGWSVRCNNAEGGTPVLSLAAVTGFQYKPTEFKRTSEPTVQGAHYWLRSGDLLMTRSNTPELVGHAAIYDGSPSPCIYPDLMMRLEVNTSRADTKFVHRWLMSIPVRDYIASASKGTSPTMKKIAQGTVMRTPFPSRFPLPEQRRIVAYLDELQAKVDALKRLQAETAAELNALLPSILDRGFRGEL
jgi:type I restriction enzyme S subunit